MKPATRPRAEPGTERLLYVDPAEGRFSHHVVGDLARLLRPERSPGGQRRRDAAGVAARPRAAARSPARAARRERRGMDCDPPRCGGLSHADRRARAAPRASPTGNALDFGDGLAATIVARTSPICRRSSTFAFICRAPRSFPRSTGARARCNTLTSSASFRFGTFRIGSQLDPGRSSCPRPGIVSPGKSCSASAHAVSRWRTSRTRPESRRPVRRARSPSCRFRSGTKSRDRVRSNRSDRRTPADESSPWERRWCALSRHATPSTAGFRRRRRSAPRHWARVFSRASPTGSFPACTSRKRVTMRYLRAFADKGLLGPRPRGRGASGVPPARIRR